MSRGAAWLIATLILLGAALFALQRTPVAASPLPVLYTLGGDFQLDSTHGKRLSLTDLSGQVVLLNFGYTGCPDVCPTALARMRDVINLLGEQKSSVQPVFVTLDPEVDTVDRIGPYLEFFDPTFIGLTGSTQEIAQAAAGYKVFYERETLPSTAGYTISHSSHIYLLDTLGQVRATFGEGVPVPMIAETVHQLLNQPDGHFREEA